MKSLVISTFFRIFDQVFLNNNHIQEEYNMAKRRTLKRSITEICTVLFAEGVAASLENEHPENADALLTSILKMERHYICRVSHAEKGMKPKLYFNDLIEKFNAQVIEIADQINNSNA